VLSSLQLSTGKINRPRGLTPQGSEEREQDPVQHADHDILLSKKDFRMPPEAIDTLFEQVQKSFWYLRGGNPSTQTWLVGV
jgi:hypothetical protein